MMGTEEGEEERRRHREERRARFIAPLHGPERAESGIAHRGFEPPVSAPRSAASWARLDEWAISGKSIP